MTDHTDAPLELVPLELCECCGVSVSRRQAGICLPCWYIWYDGGIVKREEIKAERLRRYGADDTEEFR